MRDDAQRIQDILAAAEAILDHVSGMTDDAAPRAGSRVPTPVIDRAAKRILIDR